MIVRMLRWTSIVLSFGLVAAASAQSYPTKPVQIVVPFPSGSGSDAVARIVAAKLGPELGQSAVVLNRVGASGLVAAEFVATAPPDGHTLFLASASVLTFNTALFAKLPYDPLTSFAPITIIGRQPFVVAVTPKLPVKSLGDFVALARKQPGKFTYGNTGSSVDLTVRLFANLAGIELLAVPYKGSVAAITALVTGEIDFLMDPVVSLYPQVTAGKVRALAVTSGKRSAFAPELPAVAELGYPDFDVSTWWALLAPAATPSAVVTLLHQRVLKVLAQDDVKQQIASQSVEVTPSTPAELRDLIASDGVKWRRIAAQAGVKPQ